MAIDANKIKGAISTALLCDVDTYLNEDLRSGFELLADTHPELYKALREASQVDNRGSRGRKVKRLSNKTGENTPSD